MLWYWLELINRVIVGDTLFGVSIWLSGVVAYGLSRASRRWNGLIKFIYFLIMSFGLMVLAHYAIDALQEWYTTPLGPPLVY